MKWHGITFGNQKNEITQNKHQHIVLMVDLD